MKNIFKALDGGHLDCALFPSQVKGQKDEGKDASKQTALHRRLHLGKRGSRRADTAESRTRTPRSDAGL